MFTPTNQSEFVYKVRSMTGTYQGKELGNKVGSMPHGT